MTTGIFIYILTFTDILVLAQWSAMVRILGLVMVDCGSGDASLSMLPYLSRQTASDHHPALLAAVSLLLLSRYILPQINRQSHVTLFSVDVPVSLIHQRPPRTAPLSEKHIIIHHEVFVG